jgi:hypothetical protein
MDDCCLTSVGVLILVRSILYLWTLHTTGLLELEGELREGPPRLFESQNWRQRGLGAFRFLNGFTNIHGWCATLTPSQTSLNNMDHPSSGTIFFKLTRYIYLNLGKSETVKKNGNNSKLNHNLLGQWADGPNYPCLLYIMAGASLDSVTWC